MTEVEIQETLLKQFSFLTDKIKIIRSRRINLSVEYNLFSEVFEFIVKKLKFSHLCTITGLDLSESLGFIYHLSHDNGILINLETTVSKQKPIIKTISNYFPGGQIYERELEDLLGAKVEGLQDGNRYPLTDDFPVDQFPLRKDWPISAAVLSKGSN